MIAFNEYKGIEVSGRSIYGLMQAFGQFKALASKYLLEEGIGQPGPEGLAVVDLASWYPLEAQLRALARFSREMGDSVAHQMGMSLIKEVQWLPTIHDVKTLAEFLDIGYHVNHRKDGKPMGSTNRLSDPDQVVHVTPQSWWSKQYDSLQHADHPPKAPAPPARHITPKDE